MEVQRDAEEEADERGSRATGGGSHGVRWRTGRTRERIGRPPDVRQRAGKISHGVGPHGAGRGRRVRRRAEVSYGECGGQRIVRTEQRLASRPRYLPVGGGIVPCGVGRTSDVSAGRPPDVRGDIPPLQTMLFDARAALDVAEKIICNKHAAASTGNPAASRSLPCFSATQSP